MRFLSVNDPWATLIAIGAKRIETRGWWTGYRGLIGIHATKGFSGEDRFTARSEPFRSTLRAAGIETIWDLPRGAVIAVADLADIILIQGAPIGIEGLFGDYTPGRWGWRFKLPVHRLSVPVAARGRLGLWEDADVEARVMRQMEIDRAMDTPVGERVT
jgi:hypothetical protein